MLGPAENSDAAAAMFVPMPPYECHGAGTDLRKIHAPFGDHRLSELWSKDNAADDGVLMELIEKQRLGFWFERIKACARSQMASQVVGSENGIEPGSDVDGDGGEDGEDGDEDEEMEDVPSVLTSS
jgi:hypothetical protein